MTTLELRNELIATFGADAVTFSPDHSPDDLHDESLHPLRVEPFAVVRPSSTAHVVALTQIATRHHVALTPRGSGTGLSGGATPVSGGIVVNFARMNQLLRLDIDDHVAVVQPGLTLLELDDLLATSGLCYPVHPGELSGSLGGNVNTNAGGMRAVRHGVTRSHVLGLELVLMNGTVVRTGGPVVKSSSGYDLTQLIVGSEGTLALVTEITLRLSPVLAHGATVLVAFDALETVAQVVPAIISSGLAPSMLEYIDVTTMASITTAAALELGVDASVAARTAAYLIVVLETRTARQLDDDVAALAALVEAAGSLDEYVLAGSAAARLIEARERAFWVAKSHGVNDIVDIVVPRSAVPVLLSQAARLAQHHGALITGCGHVGDGNVHLSVFLSSDEQRAVLLGELFAFGISRGGQISGEHGIGRDKQDSYLALTDPALVELQRCIKMVFDPGQLLNPFRFLDERPGP